MGRRKGTTMCSFCTNCSPNGYHPPIKTSREKLITQHTVYDAKLDSTRQDHIGQNKIKYGSHPPVVFVSLSALSSG
jgi:hypothetical protein